MTARCTLFYLHGFNSSPHSLKAREIRAYLQQAAPHIHYCVPALPFAPAAAINEIETALRAVAADRVAIVGSSLGGFYATYIAEQFGLRAALINPAVHPYLLLEKYLGDQENPYTGERYRLTRDHMQQLQQLECEPLRHRENLLLLAQLGDEVLDTQQAIEKYRGCTQIIEAGGSHAFDDFPRHIPTLLKFFEFI